MASRLGGSASLLSLCPGSQKVMLYWVSGAFGEGGIDAIKYLVLKLVLASSPCLLFGVSLSTNFGIPHGMSLVWPPSWPLTRF